MIDTIKKTSFWRIVFLALCMNFMVQWAHELGHWAVYMISGVEPTWGFTRIIQTDAPLNTFEWAKTMLPDGGTVWLKLSGEVLPSTLTVMSIAGPLFSVLLVLAGLLTARFGKRSYIQRCALLAALIGAFIMSLYYLRGFGRMSGDEWLFASGLGFSQLLLEIPLFIFFGAAFAVVIIILYRAQSIWRWLGGALLGCLPGALFMTLMDSAITEAVNAGQPWVSTIAGFAAPVLIINVLALGGIIFLGILQRHKAPNKLNV